MLHKDFVDNILIVSGLTLTSWAFRFPGFIKESLEDFVIGVVSSTGWMTSLNGHRDWLENAIVANDVHIKDTNIQISSSKKTVKEVRS